MRNGRKLRLTTRSTGPAGTGLLLANAGGGGPVNLVSLGAMDAEAKSRLAAGWVDHYTHMMTWGHDMVLHTQSLHPDVVDAVADLSYADPEEFLDVVLNIVHRSENDDVLMHVSALLQVLLETQTAKVLPRVEALAMTDAEFKKLLAWFIPSEPNNELWSRIRRVAGNVLW